MLISKSDWAEGKGSKRTLQGNDCIIHRLQIKLNKEGQKGYRIVTESVG